MFREKGGTLMKGEREKSNCGNININWISNDVTVYCDYFFSKSNYLLKPHNEIIYNLNDMVHGIYFKRIL